MIKRINHIRKFGVFKSYRRPGDIQDFSKLNIIYGWNYSGKTTVSRVFQCFENEELKEHYDGAEFELEDYEGNKGNETNLSLNSTEIKVFNSDFIKDNIHLEGNLFNPILLLGEDVKKAEETIKWRQKCLLKINKLLTTRSKKIDDLETSIQIGLTKRAAHIKEQLAIVQAFSKTHLKPIFDSVKDNPSEFIKLKSEFSDLQKKATASENDKLNKIDNYSVTLNYNELLNETKGLCSIVPEFSNTIEYFIKNPTIANWVEDGLPFHKDKSTCEFCGSELKESRIKEITAHFSEDLKEHKKLLNVLIEKISNCKIEEPKYQKSDIYKDLLIEFETNTKNVRNFVKKYNHQLENLIGFLELKKEKPFNTILDFSSIKDHTLLLSLLISSYNGVISRNRDRTDEFEQNKNDAIETLKKHYTAEFVVEIELDKKNKKILLFKNRIAKNQRIKSELQNEIQVLESQISKAHKGCDKLNEFIEKFLGREEIKVVVEKDNERERFRLKRNEAKAVNLSEGEKTAIAFSFFLTKLLECRNLSQAIVYIDDPISSLDSNHIFQVNAILKDFFFSKENSDDENPNILNCHQLFISTHNFDFFSLLRELPTPKKHKTFFYFVKRINDSEATLEKLPKAIQGYTSEYHYLFELIYKFNESGTKDINSLMGIPNAVRRFVELYTYSRLPGHYKNSTVDKRAEKLWGTEKSKRILKVFHFFSHSNNLERILKNSDLLCDIEKAVEELMELISKDTLHYDELKKTVSHN